VAQTLITRAPAPGPEEPRVRVAPSPARSTAYTVAALVGALVVVVIASRWGEALLADHVRMKIHTPPLRGGTAWRPGRSMLPAVGVAAVMIVVLPIVARRVGWWSLLLVVAASAVAWAIALALIDGRAALTDPLLPQQYLRTVPRVGDLGTFLRTFTDRLPTYNIHTQGHPPGMVVLLWTMDRIGLPGLDPNAALVLLGGGLGMGATLVAVRDVAGEAAARSAAPFLALTPAAIWWSSGDAFFAGVAAVAVTLVVLATARRDRRSDGLAVLGGLAFAATAFLSYGLVLLAIVPTVIAVRRRAWRPLVVAGATAALVIVAVALGTGFAWWDGLAATRARYFAGVASHRPYDYFLVANVAALVLMVGPATVVALTRLRHQRVAWLVVGALAVVALADLSGMSKAEVERIWLPFVPWLVAATAALGVTRRSMRGWLAAQVALGLLIAVTVRSPW
jgi:methylthioxylose transferase